MKVCMYVCMYVCIDMLMRNNECVNLPEYAKEDGADEDVGACNHRHRAAIPKQNFPPIKPIKISPGNLIGNQNR
jgi:hypothetical protein